MANTINYGFDLISYNDDIVPDKINSNFVALDSALKEWLEDITKRVNEQGYIEYSARMNAAEQEIKRIEGTGSRSIKKAVSDAKEELNGIIDRVSQDLTMQFNGRLDTLETETGSGINAVNGRVDSLVGNGSGSIDKRISVAKQSILGTVTDDCDTLEKLDHKITELASVGDVNLEVSEEFHKKWKEFEA